MSGGSETGSTGRMAVNPAGERHAGKGRRRAQAVKLLPQPQPPVAFGLWNVKPEPCIEVT